MQRNISGQKLTVFAFDKTTNTPFTGDAANLTAYVDKDYAGLTILADTSATEIHSTNAAGYYTFDLAQGETDAHTLLFTCKSVTSNIVVTAVPAVVFTTPADFSNEDVAAITTAIMTRDLSTVGATADRSLLNAIRFLRNKWVVTGTTLSVKKEDDTTEAWSATLSTNDSASPIVGVDPA